MSGKLFKILLTFGCMMLISPAYASEPEPYEVAISTPMTIRDLGDLYTQMDNANCQTEICRSVREVTKGLDLLLRTDFHNSMTIVGNWDPVKKYNRDFKIQILTHKKKI
ncbi:hypothetical protein LOC54_04000 [Acetobacter sp. AN02]|uniref:hypothetical protein n=1 Tax=Acetobacter sp. AN02 TaxID=2894186 RepID=UPI0024345EE4|nr:hypothetical protein [Acetobacter sp. AN02]MDG6094279.1 hypothetical protein [Acetobacter sp. AN02]